MKVYVLSGSSHAGKTNTLHRLAILMNNMSGKYKLDAAGAVPSAKIPFDADRRHGDTPHEATEITALRRFATPVGTDPMESL